MKTTFIYSDRFMKYDYGPLHPLKAVRLKLTHELIQACGLLLPNDPRFQEPSPAADSDLLTFHTPEYMEVLKAVNSGLVIPGIRRFGLGPGDNPVFPGLYDGVLLTAGASLLAARLVESGEAKTSFNIAGGLHHGLPSQASGFCYINDPVIAIKFLVSKGRRVAYIDIDAHHGDGVQEAFYGTDKVLTISLHETGAAIFPGTGFEHETGTGSGKGYSINLPLPPDTDDELFLHAFREIVPPLIDEYRPDVLVTQLGVDSFVTDPLAHLNYTTNGFCEAIRIIRSLSLPWVALGGGGYDPATVARAWTLAWAEMNEVRAPREMPESFFLQYGHLFLSRALHDAPFDVDEPRKERMLREIDRAIGYIKEMVLRTWTKAA